MISKDSAKKFEKKRATQAAEIEAFRLEALGLLTDRWQGLPTLKQQLGNRPFEVFRDLRDDGRALEKVEDVTRDGRVVGCKISYKRTEALAKEVKS